MVCPDDDDDDVWMLFTLNIFVHGGGGACNRAIHCINFSLIQPSYFSSSHHIFCRFASRFCQLSTSESVAEKSANISLFA